MKLTEMSYKDMKNILATIAAEAKPLLDDDEVMELFGGLSKEENEQNKEYGRRIGQKFLAALALISGKHQQVADKIFGAIFKCSEKELENKSMQEILTLSKSLLDDEVFIGFLQQFGKLAQKGSSDI